MPDFILQVGQQNPWLAFAVIVVVVGTVAWLVIGQGRSFKVWPPEIGERPKREDKPPTIAPAAPLVAAPAVTPAPPNPGVPSAPAGGKRKTADDFYPQIESVSDNYGYSQVKPDRTPLMHSRRHELSVGDVLTITITARDPQGAELQYAGRFIANGHILQRDDWVDDNTFMFRCTEACLGSLMVDVAVRNVLYPTVEDSATLIYSVLPKQRRTAA